MSEQFTDKFQKMTVLELRREAKEMGVKLGAGISKQGIVDKLAAAAAANAAEEAPAEMAAAPASQPEKEEASAPGSNDQAAHPVRSASIITDDETEDEEEDIPVLTPNPVLRPAPRPAPNPAPHSSSASSISGISSKAPAFTMEGSRAWHNPRAYQNQGPSYQRPQSWGTRAPQPGGPERRPYNSRMEQRPDQRMQQRPAPAYVSRFGPEQPAAENERPAEQRPNEYQRPNDYQRSNDYQRQQDFHSYNQQPQRPEYQQREPMNANGFGRPSQPAQSGYFHKEAAPAAPASPAAISEILAAGECGDGEGVLDLLPDGYGFLRMDNFLPGKNDVYVSNAQIRRFNLRSGDYIVGKTRPQRDADRYSALLYITEINGHAPEETPERPSFEALTPVYPKKKLTLSGKGEKDPMLRLIDLLCPIGFGQRAMIVAAPKAGKTTALKTLAGAIAKHHPKAHLMVLLVDERPEEVTDMKESVKGEVAYSTFDEPPENHTRVAELVLERALRLVERKKDVIILTDSLTRMARAYNAVAPQTARVMTGGLAAGAMNKPKHFFGAARNTREGGSLTIIATALVDTGSKMDEVIFEEFKGTGNMELALNRAMAEQRVFPAIDWARSSTRHDELLLSEEEQAASARLRALIAQRDPAEAMNLLKALIEKTESNDELVEQLDTLLGE